MTSAASVPITEVANPTAFLKAVVLIIELGYFLHYPNHKLPIALKAGGDQLTQI
jgi:hypothetical protein